jgi:drug/metabolite transporter (DMT)-like permease
MTRTAAARLLKEAGLRGVEVPVHTLALGQQLGALVWLAVPGLAWMPGQVPTMEAMLSVLALGVPSTAVAYVLFFRLLASVGPTKTATVTYLIPVTGLMWGIALLDEPVRRGMIAGLGIVLGNVMLVSEVRVGAAVRLVTARRRHAR